MTSARLSRRQLLRGASLATLAIGAPGLLSACGTSGAKVAAGDCVTEDLSATQKSLRFSNWPLYIDEKKVERDGKKVTVHPTLEDFEAASGITVDYVPDVNDNNEFFGIVRSQLAACEPTGRDLFIVTDWMAARMIGLGWIQEYDKDNLPNVTTHLLDSLAHPEWDPERSHSVPWQTGMTGIAYNARLTGEVRSFDDLLTRPDLKGKVSLLSEMRDTMLFMLLLEGADPEKFTADQYAAACERLRRSVDSGQIRAFTGNEYAQDLVNGNVAACEAWSGDVIQLQIENPDIKFVVPEEGLSLWSDAMLVPNGGEHKANAEKLIDFYYQPEVAARLSAWVNYTCPVKGAQDEMVKIDPSLAENPLIFPTDEFLSVGHGFMALDQKTDQEYERQFSAVIGA